MRSILSWGIEENSQIIHEHRTQPEEHQRVDKVDEDNTNKQKKAVTFEANQNTRNHSVNAKNNVSLSQSKKANATTTSTVKAQ